MKRRVFRVTAEELSDGSQGRCRACGHEADGVEPDARNYECENCGAKQVFGLEELLMMGEVELEDGDE